MASEIRVDKINSLSGVGTVTLSPTGVDIAGITTAATLRATTGIVTSLTAGSLTSLGAVSGTTGTFTGDVDIADKIVHTGDTNTAIRFPAADTVTAETGGSERVRIDSSGRVIIGHNASVAGDGSSEFSFQILGTTYVTSGLSQQRYANDVSGPSIILSKSRATSVGTHTIVQDDDQLGKIRFYGSDGNDFDNYGAEIAGHVDGSPGSNDMPGRLVFKTTADGAASPTERLRIKSDGTITINSTGTQPSGTVSGYQFDAVAATFRLGSGAGASGTTSSSISLMGSNHNSNIENGANSGAQMNLYNYNTSDGNSSAVSFLNSNGLSVSRILGLNVSHSSRTGALVFMTSNGSHPTEKLRITSTGEIKQYGFTGTSDTAADDLVLGNTTGGVNRGITIWSNSSQNGGIVFADNDSNFRGSVQYLHNGDIMRLLTAGDERVRIEPNSGIGNVVIQGEVSGGTTYGLEIIGNQETNPVTNKAGARIIAPDSRRMYFELRANDDTDHFAWLGNPDYDTGIADTVMMQLSAKGRLTIPTQPRALVKIGSTTTLGNAKITNWASPIFNVGNLWNAANSRFIAPEDGLYLVGGNFRIGAPGKIRVVRFNLQAYNTSGGHMATYGGGFGGTHNYDGGSGGYDHPYVSFTNAIYLTTGQYLELHCSETAVEHTSYIQVSNEQSAMWCVLLQ
mgnify:CR=1 FL=1